MRNKGYLGILLFVAATIFSDSCRASSSDYCSPPQPEVTKEEIALYEFLCGNGNLGVLRKGAEEILASNRDSFVARIVLGRVDFKNGRFPQCIHKLKVARVLIENLSNQSGLPRDDEPQWHALVISLLAETYGAMDNRKKELRLIDEYERLGYWGREREHNLRYKPASSKIIALLKSGRILEAEELALRQSDMPGMTEREERTARMDMARVQFAKEPDGKAAYDLYKELHGDIASEGKGLSGTMLNTLAYHSLRQGEYSEAIDYLEDSVNIQRTGSASHPYGKMAQIYTLQGKWPEAMKCLGESWNWIRGKRGDIHQNLYKDSKLNLAQFYLATGYPDKAWLTLVPLSNKPIRTGYTTRNLSQWEAGFLLLLLVSSRQTREMIDESLYDRSWFANIKTRFSQLHRRWTEYFLIRRLKKKIVDQLYSGVPLRDAFFLIYCPNWMWGEAVQILGPNISKKLFQEYPLPGKRKQLFENAVRTEIAYASGDWEEVRAAGVKALQALPAEELLWRARVYAMLGQAEMRSDGIKEAIRWFGEACRLNSAVFRQLGIELPVNLVVGESVPDRTKLKKAFSVSPRLKVNGDGFLVDVTAKGSLLKWMLTGPGFQSNGKVEVDNNSSLLEIAGNCIREFHRRVFSPLESSLEEKDFSRLDGNARGVPAKQKSGLAEWI